ncbi:hypothetical protein P167DRAFT_519136 [Morchella conica CCBAS932]|uniref:Intermediate filament protein n=1 Tax=Morchella conica CCBAS932 TaxID=1392247 RepID=A0A3N4KWJ6_9PEZI|nr:hypothetical protein P167DRAFT_519136 [Morchella conica CCBAS932]
MPRSPPRLLSALLALSLLLVLGARLFPPLRYLLWSFLLGGACTLLGLLALLALTANQHPPDSALRTIKPLAFTHPTKWTASLDALTTADTFHRTPLHPPSFLLSDTLDSLIDTILRTFVTSWYRNITPDPSFPTHLDRTIRHVLQTLQSRLAPLDLVSITVSRIVPLLTAHLHDFTAAERLVRGKNLNKNLTESAELDLAIAAKYREGRLHPAAGLRNSDTHAAQTAHLRSLVERVLPHLLPQEELASPLVRVLVRELVAGAVLAPVLAMLAEPDFWNQFVEAIGRSTLQDRKTVRKLRAALDQHATPAATKRSSSSSTAGQQAPQKPFVRLGPKDDERTFERFIRSIRLCTNLSDARRLRNEISAQLKRDGRVEGNEGWAVYLKRLETGKRVVDQKVASLSAAAGGGTFVGGRKAPSRLESATLDQVLRDSAGLSYFMEHMDRQKHLAHVQFWLVVDGLRNPLEEDITSSDSECESVSTTTTSIPPWTPSDRNDLAQIHDAYLSIPELHISDRSRAAVSEFLAAGSKATQAQYVKARAAILRAQTGVFEEMQKKDFVDFRASGLFYKYLASDEAGAAAGASAAAMATVTTDLHRSSSWTDTAHGATSTSSPTDLTTMEDSLSSSRHSLDGPRAELDDWDQDALSASRTSLEDRRNSANGTPENGIVEAMEAALNDIIESRPTTDDALLTRDDTNSSPRSSIDLPLPPPQPTTTKAAKPKPANAKPPSISSLGLVGGSTRDAVFADELFPDDDAPEYASDPSGGEEEDDDDGVVHQAAPGDLGLAEAISALSFDIGKLGGQEAVVESLLRKAELTGNVVELRILRKSLASLQREVRRKELQRQMYIVQESDNGLFGRSTIRIKSTMVGNENGQEYALYIIEVQRKGGEQMPAAQWAVARRYSEFFQLNQALRARFDSVKALDFPRRRVVMKLQKDFLEKRRVALEKYLKSVLLIPDVCRSRELRAFLSQQSIAPALPGSPSSRRAGNGTSGTDIISRLYSTLADGMEDVLGTLPPLPTDTSSSSSKARVDAAEAEKELSAFEDKELEPFVKPICDLFLEVFELNRGRSGWLRGRAVVVVLHQLLGGTIERKAREQVRVVTGEESVIGYVKMLREALVPGVERKVRTQKERVRTREQAGAMLATLLPDVAASVVGRANAQAAGRRLFAAFNNQRLNTSIIYAIVDEIVAAVFNDPKQP